MHYATFTDARGKVCLSDEDPDDLTEKMAAHVRGLLPDPTVLPRDASEALAEFERIFHGRLGSFSLSDSPASLWLFTNLTGGATYSPTACKVGSCTSDCDNMQALGVGNGATPLEAWRDLLESQPDLVDQGWEDEKVVAYPLAGGAVHGWYNA